MGTISQEMLYKDVELFQLISRNVLLDTDVLLLNVFPHRFGVSYGQVIWPCEMLYGL